MSKKSKRLHWLDNLRTFMIFLVLVAHVALVYEQYNMGTSWWIVTDVSNSDLYSILFIIVDIFVMATIFFVSGYLVPQSIKNKTNSQFIWSKFKRLIIPWIAAVLTLIPLYKYIFLLSRNLPQEHWSTYFHWDNSISQYWLWFLPVLFLFNILYLLIKNINTEKLNLLNSTLVTLIVCFIYSFIIDYFEFIGWTKTILIDFQNERLLIYFVVFILGVQYYMLDAFSKIKMRKKINILIHSVGCISINLYIFFIVYELINPNDFVVNKIVHIALYRMFFTLALTYLLFAFISLFKDKINITNKFTRMLNSSSYGVYIIHVIALGIISTTLLNIDISHFMKFTITVLITYLICITLVYIYLVKIKKPLLKK